VDGIRQVHGAKEIRDRSTKFHVDSSNDSMNRYFDGVCGDVLGGPFQPRLLSSVRRTRIAPGATSLQSSRHSTRRLAANQRLTQEP
jgi:hypothetical protein